MAARLVAGAWVLTGLLAAGLSQSARAEAQYETLYERKAWQVQVVKFDDGSFSCLAEVSEGDESFTVWADESSNVQLQFYSSEWDFGEGDTANLEVEVDHRSPWNLTDAELYQHSVLFNLPDSDIGTKFLLEVVKGTTLFLRDAEGEDVRSYSLAGSSASIQSLIDCVDGISGSGKRSNPFK